MIFETHKLTIIFLGSRLIFVLKTLFILFTGIDQLFSYIFSKHEISVPTNVVVKISTNESAVRGLNLIIFRLFSIKDLFYIVANIEYMY